MTTVRARIVAAAAASVVVFWGAGIASAGVVGDIQACYNCSNNVNFGGGAVVDGPIFLIENTSGSAITGGIFSADIGGSTSDSFSVGTIAAGGSKIVEPGVTMDGSPHTGFFTVFGSVRDTSDVGPNDGSTQFEFTGLLGLLSVDTGIFTPAATAGPSNDGTITSENFLGGGPQSDGPCNDCFGPKIIATLSTPSTTTVSEPGTLTLVGTALLGLAVLRRRRT